MLILTRRKGEMIRVGEDIDIYVGEISPSQVKLCIQAPKDVKILRSELIGRKVEPKPAPIIEQPIIKIKKSRKKVAA